MPPACVLASPEHATQSFMSQALKITETLAREAPRGALCGSEAVLHPWARWRRPFLSHSLPPHPAKMGQPAPAAYPLHLTPPSLQLHAEPGNQLSNSLFRSSNGAGGAEGGPFVEMISAYGRTPQFQSCSGAFSGFNSKLEKLMALGSVTMVEQSGLNCGMMKGSTGHGAWGHATICCHRSAAGLGAPATVRCALEIVRFKLLYCALRCQKILHTLCHSPRKCVHVGLHRSEEHPLFSAPSFRRKRANFTFCLLCGGRFERPQEALDALAWMMANDNEARQIARNAQLFAKEMLNKQALRCYWMTLFREYAKLFKYRPADVQYDTWISATEYLADFRVNKPNYTREWHTFANKTGFEFEDPFGLPEDA
eukprot:1138003-Pelagomonas_calceolata.AAC.4